MGVHTAACLSLAAVPGPHSTQHTGASKAGTHRGGGAKVFS